MTASDVDNHGPAQAIEFHFTEGFREQSAQILCDGEKLASFTLTSAFQTGLAHIEILQLDEGKEVAIEIGDQPLRATAVVDAAHPFVVVALEGDRLDLAVLASRPGYV